MPKEKEIRFSVELDKDGVPVAIYWEASDAPVEGKRACDSLMVSMWDNEEKNALSIDLWTQDMKVGEMNAYFFLTILKMADTYERATNNKELADMIRRFANDFADKVDELAGASEKNS